MEETASRPVLIDTNIFVDHLRNFAPAVSYFESLSGRNNIFFSAITEAELLAGKANMDQSKRDKLIHFLNSWNKVAVINQIALLAGDTSREYGLEIPDAIIAATAILNNAELITRNIKDFKKIPGLKMKSPY